MKHLLAAAAAAVLGITLASSASALSWGDTDDAGSSRKAASSPAKESPTPSPRLPASRATA